MTSTLPPEAADLAWVHVGADLVVADKPAGMLSVPGRGADKADCVWTRAQALFPDALIVHRLDLATSGLIVLARGVAMQRLISRRFETRQVGKQYVAVVAGWVAGERGEIDLPLAADWPNRPRQSVNHQRGRPALTRWQVIARDPEGRFTRLRLEPLTGRTHQLRVHLAAIGHPILGDRLYAPPAACSAAPRLLLHASGLDLGRLGPDGARAVFASPPPF
jgi:tRNA pseudouridine32 synthase/23S rRNA pseudouridine746 synthase